MKKIILFACLSGMYLAACKNAAGTDPNATATTPSTSTTTPAVNANALPAQLEVKMDISKKGEGDGGTSSVAVFVNGKSFEVVKDLMNPAIAMISDKAVWAEKKIPAEALAVCGGFWAGFDDFVYVVKEGDKLVVFQGGAGEEENSKYEYKAVKEILAADLK
jgi:hypothetical protein